MLAFSDRVCYYTVAVRKQHNIRVWRSLVSRLNGVQEAAGSNPVTRTKREETTQVSSLFLCSEQRTGGLLLRRQAHFNLPHGNAARSAAFPTGSNPVTRTKREETVVVSSLFLCIRLEQPAFYHIEVPCTVWQFPRQLIRDLTESSEHDAGAGDGRQDKG